MKKNNILEKITRKIFLKQVKMFESNTELQQKALVCLSTRKGFQYKKYEKYLKFILERVKFEADMFQSAEYIDTFVDMRDKCIDDLQFLSKYELFTSGQKPSYYLGLFISMKEEIEIDFLRRTYKRDSFGLLNIPIYDMTIINKNFTQEAIDFIAKDNGGITQKQKKNFDNMVGYEFEKFCSELLVKIGFSNVKNTQLSSDQGIDILAEKSGVKYAIQCKCYSGNVGNKAVQEAFSGCRFYDCHVPVVMTNSYFTDSAKQLAEKNNVLLWDRDILISYIER